MNRSNENFQQQSTASNQTAPNHKVKPEPLKKEGFPSNQPIPAPAPPSLNQQNQQQPHSGMCICNLYT